MAIHPVTDRWPRSGISILIVGAGTAGLFAALECWRKGHDVRVLEKAPEPYSAGKHRHIQSKIVLRISQRSNQVTVTQLAPAR